MVLLVVKVNCRRNIKKPENLKNWLFFVADSDVCSAIFLQARYIAAGKFINTRSRAISAEQRPKELILILSLPILLF